MGEILLACEKYQPEISAYMVSQLAQNFAQTTIYLVLPICFINCCLCLHFPFTALVDAIVRKETDEIRNILESEDVDING